MYIHIKGIYNYWTAPLDWNTRLDCWTKLFNFPEQVLVFTIRKNPKK